MSVSNRPPKSCLAATHLGHIKAALPVQVKQCTQNLGSPMPVCVSARVVRLGVSARSHEHCSVSQPTLRTETSAVSHKGGYYAPGWTEPTPPVYHADNNNNNTTTSRHNQTKTRTGVHTHLNVFIGYCDAGGVLVADTAQVCKVGR